MAYQISNKAPTVREFALLRKQVGWGETDEILAQTSLNNSLFHVTIRHQDALIAMGRVIGDGGLFFYIQDVVVAPDYQGEGLGHAVMYEIERYVAKNAKLGATVALLSAKGKEAFYEQYDYIVRTGEPLGLGMCKFV
ncbi:N-acetyltransferase [Pseudoalteromonas sp. A25]|uniref:GNAT family N-acetyltransferase n=1 Tax=Pseudoalteromonas sp. A25 TaxID=116092 RepID=UPI001261335D|nr:GNAT family N-acetyltransferase [Pseudoalteromonas sp. A25]BBN80906.1 N-acetyltransferase [Pseudoalteromonas sp. A25]